MEFSWLGSWSEHKEGVSSVEPEPRVNGLTFVVGLILVGGRAEGPTEWVGGKSCAPSKGGPAWMSGGGSTCGIDEKSKEVFEVVNRRFGLEVTVM